MGSRGQRSASAKNKNNSFEIGTGKANIVSSLDKEVPRIIKALTDAYNSGQRNSEGSKYLTAYIKGAKSSAVMGVTMRKKGRAKNATYGRVYSNGKVEGNYKTADGVAKAVISSLYARGEN